jgi:hypothetical protein
LRALLGLIRPTGGTAMIDGLPYAEGLRGSSRPGTALLAGQAALSFLIAAVAYTVLTALGERVLARVSPWLAALVLVAPLAAVYILPFVPEPVRAGAFFFYAVSLLAQAAVGYRRGAGVPADASVHRRAARRGRQCRLLDRVSALPARRPRNQQGSRDRVTGLRPSMASRSARVSPLCRQADLDRGDQQRQAGQQHPIASARPMSNCTSPSLCT